MSAPKLHIRFTPRNLIRLPHHAGEPDRGLLLVEHVADRWGTTGHGCTWCTLTVTARPEHAR